MTKKNAPRVLIVENYEQARHQARDALVSCGWDVTVETYPLKAIAIIKNSKHKALGSHYSSIQPIVFREC